MGNDALISHTCRLPCSAGTPFEGGYFKVRFQFGADFPNQPPKCWFGTKIFHPNVAPSTGEICVSTLKKDWKKEYGVGHILITVKCLLIHPNPESALHEEAGKLLLEAYNDYAHHARLMTDVHARHRPAEFTNVSSSTSYQPLTSTSTSASATSSGASTPAMLPSSSSTARTTSPSSSAPLDTLSAPLTNSSKGDTHMQDTEMKPTTSSSGASTPSLPAVGTAATTIPKKRAAPTPATGLGHQGILGASSAAGVSSGNTVKKTAPTAGASGAQAPKKRGLKRL